MSYVARDDVHVVGNVLKERHDKEVKVVEVLIRWLVRNWGETGGGLREEGRNLVGSHCVLLAYTMDGALVGGRR